jgi:glycine/D-amino acid oxidase-like deaminating enzyme
MPEGTIDLRSGQTVWRLKHGPPRQYAPLRQDTSCEVVIIGGGITGAMIAAELVNAGVDCIVIDQSSIGGGSTSASTALLLYELDTPMVDLATRIGEVDAAACYHVCLGSISKIEHLIKTFGLHCGYQSRSSYYLADTIYDVAGLRQEWALRKGHGMNVEFLGKEQIEERFSFSRPGALLSGDAAEIDVVAFVDGLIRRSIEKGVRVYGETPMATYRETVSGVLVRTKEGCEIRAQRAVFATGYESERYVGRRIGSLKSTYALATKPIDEFRGWHERSLLWTTKRPYLYLRTTRDSRAVIGGGDIDFHDEETRDALLPEKEAELEVALRTMFPEMEFEVDCAWAGTFGETKDSLAYIGSPPGMPRAYFALGYGGNGIAYSAIAAEIIHDAYLGRPNEAARLFRFDR